MTNAPQPYTLIFPPTLLERYMVIIEKSLIKTVYDQEDILGQKSPKGPNNSVRRDPTCNKKYFKQT